MKSFIDLNAQGFIPGPQETEEAFLSRVYTTQDTHHQDLVSKEAWEAPFSRTQKLFDIRPEWVTAHYSNKNVYPWEGAAIWIGEKVVIQLRTAFRKGHFLRLYQRDEVLAHEAVHAARMAFNEPRFEELFAYMTSQKRWRTILGPFFHSSNESLLFFFSLFFSCLGCLFLSSYFVLVPLLLLITGALRLIHIRKIFFKALKICADFTKHPLPFLFRLTDDEIFLFAKGSKEEIKKYIANQHSFRWQMIQECYL